MMSEKLSLQWNDFKENAVNAFGSLKEDKDFTDVTLVCEDGKQVEAHKVILANSSPFFQHILRKNKHINPLVYMRGVKSDDLFAIVDFLYCGEANIYQENLDSFLAIAEELQLKGLMGDFKMSSPQKVRPVLKKESGVSPSRSYFGEQKASSAFDTAGGGMALTSHFPSGDLKELDEKCISMMEKTLGKNAHGQPLYRCKVCGKEGINGTSKRHIETNHLEGISIPCNFCEKTFRSRTSLTKHIHGNHKDCKENTYPSFII